MFASPPLQSLPSLKTLYLDTTYCDSQYSFPLQEEVVSFIVNRVIAEKKTKKRLMVVCGTYTIGKERIFLGTYICVHTVCKPMYVCVCVRVHV